MASFIGEGTGIPGENNRPVTSYWQTLSHKVVSFKPTKLTIWKVYSKYWPTTRQFLPMSHKNNLKFLHKVQDHREKTKFDSRRVSLVEQELLTLPEYPSSPSVFSGVRVTRSLVLCVMFCRLFVFFFWPLCCLFFFDIPILITSWYLQTLLDHFTVLELCPFTLSPCPMDKHSFFLLFKSWETHKFIKDYFDKIREEFVK